MGRKIYTELGERDYLNPKLQKISKECTDGRKRVYIPELRLTVFTRFNETVEETKARYLSKTLTYGKKIKEDSEAIIETVQVEDVD
jgi:hypothetical protein